MCLEMKVMSNVGKLCLRSTDRMCKLVQDALYEIGFDLQQRNEIFSLKHDRLFLQACVISALGTTCEDFSNQL